MTKKLLNRPYHQKDSRGYPRPWLSMIMLLLLTACTDKLGREQMNLKDFFTDPKVIELVNAVEQGNVEKIKALRKQGVDVNTVGKEGMTPLMWVLGKQSKQGMRILLTLGANPNFVAPNGESVVTMAAGAEDSELLKIVMDGGGNPDIKNSRGEPVLFTAIEQRRWLNLRLLLDSGADINAVDKAGETAMLRAATLNQFEQVAYLIGRGADFTIPNIHGGSVALRVQERRLNPELPNYQWQQKVRKMLEARGVKFPVPKPWEQNK